MNLSISRRRVIGVVCAAAVTTWAVASDAAAESFEVALAGAQKVPPVETAGKGTADLTYDPATRVLTWSVTYEGLSGPATMAHFHGPAPAGKNGPVVIWLSKKGSEDCSRTSDYIAAVHMVESGPFLPFAAVHQFDRSRM